MSTTNSNPKINSEFSTFQYASFTSQLYVFTSVLEREKFIATMLLGNNVALVLYGIFMGDRILQIFYPQTFLSGEASLLIVFYQTLISTLVILITAGSPSKP